MTDKFRDHSTRGGAGAKPASICIEFNQNSRILPSDGGRPTSGRQSSTGAPMANYGTIRRVSGRTSMGSLNSFSNSNKFYVDSMQQQQDDEQTSRGCVTIAGLIGDFGWFQFLVLLFSALREASVGYDAVVMSIILQPEEYFLCADKVQDRAHQMELLDELARSAAFAGRPPEGAAPAAAAAAANFSAASQCFWAAEAPGKQLGEPCQSWLFPEAATRGGVSLVAEWSLVCQRGWLVAFIESAYFLGLMSGNMLWGYYADKLGRRKAYLLAHTLALVSGWASILAPNMLVFTLCRYLSACGMVGYNVIYSIQVELIGSKYRAFSTTMNHLGWGLGVLMVPLADYTFDKYRYIVAVAPMIALLMYPWAFLLPESPRWLMAHNKFDEAKRELIRAAKANAKPIDLDFEKKLSALMDKALSGKNKQGESTQQAQGFFKSYKMILSDRNLTRDTLILAYITFIGHFFYYMLTINFAYMKNLSLEANFITSGLGEWVGLVLGAFLLQYFLRKTCMGVFLIIMASSFALQALVDSGLVPVLDTMPVVTSINAAGTLSSLLLIFVALIVNQEVFPTVIRQTGSSLVNTFGESGSTLAPLMLQLGRLIGYWRADAICAALSLFGAYGVTFITKTDNMELSDV